MSREIKFRALVDDMAMRWAYGNLVYQGDVPRIQEVNGVYLFTTCLKGSEGQFTGLRDKNGNEIYEGDVVRFPLLDNRGGHPVVVEWKDAGWNWLNIHYTGGLEVEVIGNIHENPELLNQTEP